MRDPRGMFNSWKDGGYNKDSKYRIVTQTKNQQDHQASSSSIIKYFAFSGFEISKKHFIPMISIKHFIPMIQFFTRVR